MSSNLLDGITPKVKNGATKDGDVYTIPKKTDDSNHIDHLVYRLSIPKLESNRKFHVGFSRKAVSTSTDGAEINISYKDDAGNINYAAIHCDNPSAHWEWFSGSITIPSGMRPDALFIGARLHTNGMRITNITLSYDSPIALAVAEITAADVNDGTGIKSITPQYYLSTSNSAQADGSWSDKEPAYKSGKYYWTRSKIVWDDGTTTYTAAVLAEGVNNANSSAQNANEAASIAQNTASKAQSAANSAASAASKAQSSANQAQATADAAITSSTTAVASTVVQYIQTADQTTPADDASGWSENTVQYDSNKYIWMRVIYKLKDGTTTVGKPVALTAGVQRDLNSMKQAFWADSTGAHVKSGNGGETVVKGDGVHINVNGNEVANYTASGGEITQLTVDSYLYSGAHRIEKTTMFGEKGTGFFWKG